MKNKKILYLLITLIFIYFTGCEGSDPARNPTEKKDAPNQTVVTKKKESWKWGSPEKGKKQFRTSNNKKKTNVRLKEIEPGPDQVAPAQSVGAAQDDDLLVACHERISESGKKVQSAFSCK